MVTAVVRKEKRSTPYGNPMVQGSSSGGFRKKQKTTRHADPHDAMDPEADATASKDAVSSRITLTYQAEGSAMPSQPSDMGATRHAQHETAYDRDAQALLEKSIQLSKVSNRNELWLASCDA